MEQELNEFGNPKTFTVHGGELRRWSSVMEEYVPVHAADNFTRIVDGLRVWDYDMRRGVVSLSNVDVHDGWFDVVREDGQRKLMNSERVVPNHPRTGEAA